MTEVISIKFKSDGASYYFAPDGKQYSVGSYAVVETAQGIECGVVSEANHSVEDEKIVQPLKKALRPANERDLKKLEENKEKAKEAFKICEEKVLAHGLDMKLIEAQYSFDGSKIIFFFTSDGRVDFRELVKDLAASLHIRIELRQIGGRDEARMLGGLGICGQPFCCSRFLNGFQPVSIKMAKEQGLSLNPTKISGTCGRLMCCLRYEQETYEYEIARTPAVDSTVKTADGVGTVTEMHPLTGLIKVKLRDKDGDIVKIYHRDDVKLVHSQKKTDKE